MSYHSAQVHLAVRRLISVYGFETSMRDLDCSTVDVDGDVAYRISARGEAEVRLVRVLREALGAEELQRKPGGLLINMEEARRLIDRAYS